MLILAKPRIATTASRFPFVFFFFLLSPTVLRVWPPTVNLLSFKKKSAFCQLVPPGILGLPSACNNWFETAVMCKITNSSLNTQICNISTNYQSLKWNKSMLHYLLKVDMIHVCESCITFLNMVWQWHILIPSVGQNNFDRLQNHCWRNRNNSFGTLHLSLRLR